MLVNFFLLQYLQYKNKTSTYSFQCAKHIYNINIYLLYTRTKKNIEFVSSVVGFFFMQKEKGKAQDFDFYIAWHCIMVEMIFRTPKT